MTRDMLYLFHFAPACTNDVVYPIRRAMLCF